MKVLMLNGSAHTHGNTYIALEEIGKTLKEEGIDYEIFQIGGKPVRDCIDAVSVQRKAAFLMMMQ